MKRQGIKAVEGGCHEAEMPDRNLERRPANRGALDVEHSGVGKAVKRSAGAWANRALVRYTGPGNTQPYKRAAMPRGQT